MNFLLKIANICIRYYNFSSSKYAYLTIKVEKPDKK